MNIRNTTITAAFCCILLSSGCVYDKKRVVSPNTNVASTPGLETTEDTGSKTVMQPHQIGMDSGQQYLGDSSDQDFIEVSGDPQVLPDIQYVKDRIFEYGRKLDRWKELDNKAIVMDLDEEASEEMVRCFRDLQKVLNGYL